MTDDADDLDRRLARLFEEGRREDPKEHPAPEKLSAYQAKELTPEEADAIQEHLVQCAFCTDLLLDLQRFLEPEEKDGAREGVADLGAEAGWRKVRGEMGWKGRAAGPAEDVSRLRRIVRGLQALAAVLVVGVVGLSIYALHLREQAGASGVLVSAAPYNTLGKRSGPDDEVEILELAPGDRIVFTLYDLKASEELQVKIQDARGKTVWSRSGLTKRGNSLAFPVPPNALKAGYYNIIVTSGDQRVGEYPVRIVNFQ